MNPILQNLEGMVILGSPLILAAMAGLLSERSGVMDIALEGKMLTACICAFVAGIFIPGPLAVLVGIISAVLLSLAHYVLTQNYRIDHIVSGMGLNAIAFGFSDVLAQRYKQESSQLLAVPVFMGIALLFPFALWVWMKFSKGGLSLLAVGSDPDKARHVGISPRNVRFWAAIVNGVLCGLAGGMLVAEVGSFTVGMTAGKGFIALAALIIGGWRALPALATCLMIGLLLQLRITFQGVPVFGVELPGWVWLSMPYLVTVIFLAMFRGVTRAPAGLGKP